MKAFELEVTEKGGWEAIQPILDDMMFLNIITKNDERIMSAAAPWDATRTLLCQPVRYQVVQSPEGIDLLTGHYDIFSCEQFFLIETDSIKHIAVLNERYAMMYRMTKTRQYNDQSDTEAVAALENSDKEKAALGIDDAGGPETMMFDPTGDQPTVAAIEDPTPSGDAVSTDASKPTVKKINGHTVH